MTETFSHIPASEIQALVADFKNTHQIVLSNYFGVKESDDHEMLVSAQTLLLRKKEHDFQRLFLLSSDEAELVALLKTLDDEDYVLNIPTKKGIGQWEQVLSEAGFTFLAQYDRYYNREIEYRESDIGTFATEEDVREYDLIAFEESINTRSSAGTTFEGADAYKKAWDEYLGR